MSKLVQPGATAWDRAQLIQAGHSVQCASFGDDPRCPVCTRAPSAADLLQSRLLAWWERFSVEHISAKVSDDPRFGERCSLGTVTPSVIYSALVLELRNAVEDGSAQLTSTDRLVVLAERHLRIDVAARKIYFDAVALAHALCPPEVSRCGQPQRHRDHARQLGARSGAHHRAFRRLHLSSVGPRAGARMKCAVTTCTRPRWGSQIVCFSHWLVLGPWSRFAKLWL